MDILLSMIANFTCILVDEEIGRKGTSPPFLEIGEMTRPFTMMSSYEKRTGIMNFVGAANRKLSDCCHKECIVPVEGQLWCPTSEMDSKNLACFSRR